MKPTKQIEFQREKAKLVRLRKLARKSRAVRALLEEQEELAGDVAAFAEAADTWHDQAHSNAAEFAALIAQRDKAEAVIAALVKEFPGAQAIVDRVFAGEQNSSSKSDAVQPAGESAPAGKAAESTPAKPSEPSVAGEKPEAKPEATPAKPSEPSEPNAKPDSGNAKTSFPPAASKRQPTPAPKQDKGKGAK